MPLISCDEPASCRGPRSPEPATDARALRIASLRVGIREAMRYDAHAALEALRAALAEEFAGHASRQDADDE